MVSPDLATGALTGRRRRRYAPASYGATPVPTGRERHLLNRMGCGFSPESFRQLRAAGGAPAWFERQLDPASVPESDLGAQVADWFPRLGDTPAQVWSNDRQDVHHGWEYARDLSNYSMLRRIYSTRTVHESMAELWSNHFHVDAQHFPGFTQRPAYDATIREHALGTFEELLVAATLHPAMLMFLDNWKSVRNAPNENHGRELLELHTVGAAAGYTEAMVKDSAKLLSGHTVRERTWTAYYDPDRHTTGAVDVLGFRSANAVADDPELAVDYLRFLAHHPATARRIATKLAVRFVQDDPPAALVDRLAGVFLDSGTDIKATLRALVASEEFWASAGRKVRTPIDDVVATCRVLGVEAAAPVNLRSFVNELSWALGSTLAFQWPRPDGAPDRADVWASTTRMLNSWRMHWGMAGGWWPDGEATYRPPTEFLPRSGIRFDELVDHLSRVVLGRRSTRRLLKAACVGCGVAPDQTVTEQPRGDELEVPPAAGGAAGQPAAPDPMKDRLTMTSMSQDRTCCEEYRRAGDLSRRRLLGGMAAAGAATVSTSLFGQAVRQTSFGAETGGNVLVVVSFRGGIDGLGMVVPHGDPGYYAARPRIGVPKASLVAKDAMFGLHPEMAPLQWLWDAGELAAVQAVGMAQPNRSHFAAMELIEDAAPGSSLRQGWVNRMVGLGGSGAATDAVHLGSATPPTLVEGPAPTVATQQLSDVRLSGSDAGWARRRRAAPRDHVGPHGQPDGGGRPVGARHRVGAGHGRGGHATSRRCPTRPAWPATDLSNALKDTARLIKADLGTEVVSVDYGSWDMHDGYGTLAWGDMQTMTRAFARSMSAFLADLGPLRSRVTVVTISEFGRRVAENGNQAASTTAGAT